MTAAEQNTREHKEIREALQSLDVAIRGNGRPGILTRLAVVQVVVAGVLSLNVMIIGTMITIWIKA